MFARVASYVCLVLGAAAMGAVVHWPDNGLVFVVGLIALQVFVMIRMYLLLNQSLLAQVLSLIVFPMLWHLGNMLIRGGP